jgi:parvulin-like peptidyl-prolyl isomerase
VSRHQLLRKELGEAPSLAAAAAKDGEVVGPVATPEGFALARIVERHEAVLGPAIRQAIQQELFEKWLADATREAALDLAVVGTAG